MDVSHQLVILIPAGYGLRPNELSEYLEYVEYSPPKGLLYWLWRLWFDFFEIPRVATTYQVAAVFALGNHLPARIDVPGVVLYRNPHYVLPVEALSLPKRLERMLFGLTVRRGHHFIAQTEMMKRKLVDVWGLSEVQVSVVPNGVSPVVKRRDTPRQLVQRDSFRLLYVSRYYPHKNHEFLIALLARFAELGIDQVEIRCTVDASGSAGLALQRSARRAGVERFLTLIGEVSDAELSNEYESADAFIYPSTMETFGNPLVEALCAGLPVFVADMPYAHEICGDAAIYFSLDRVDDVRRKIEVLINDADGYAARSELSLERAGRYPDWSTVARQYLQILQRKIETSG